MKIRLIDVDGHNFPNFALMKISKTKPASMRVQKALEKVENRTCGECKHGCWNEWNLNYKGNRFYGYCEHSKWAKTKDGRGVFLDNSKACALFEEGEKQKGSAK